MSTTDPTPGVPLTGTLTEPASEAPDQMSAPPVDNPVDSTPPAPLTEEDWHTIRGALGSWHRAPDSVLHRRATELLGRIEAGIR